MADQLELYDLEKELWYRDMSEAFTLDSDTQKRLDKPQYCVTKIKQPTEARKDQWEKLGQFATSLIGDRFKKLSFELIKGMKIDGQPLKIYFDQFNKLEKVINLLQSKDGVATDVIGILCLIASMGNDLTNVLKGKDVEKSWQNVIKKKKQATAKAKNSYAQHKDKYQQIFDCICTMIGTVHPQAELCIRVAAFLVTIIWPQRECLASWIVDSWKLTSDTAVRRIVPAARSIVPAVRRIVSDNVGFYVVAAVVVVLVGMLRNRLTY